MQEPHTDNSSRKPLFVRDHLAEYRTALANKRTFLSHIRTALAVFAAGLALIKFFGHPIVVTFGVLLLPAGILILIHGVITYRNMNKVTRAEEEKLRKSIAQDQ